MEQAQDTNNAADAQSRAAEGGANLTDVLAAGKLAHYIWESTRKKDDDECDEERRIRGIAFAAGIEIPAAWHEGWFQRSDNWRDESTEAANVKANLPPERAARREPTSAAGGRSG